MKEIWIDNKNAIDVLSAFADELNSASHDKLKGHPRIPRILNLMGEIVFTLTQSPLYDRRLLEDIIEEISDKSRRFSELLDEQKGKIDADISFFLLDVERTLYNYTKLIRENAENKNLNSLEFYQKRLSDLEASIEKLESEKMQNNQKAKKKDEEIRRLSFVIQETQKQLDEKTRQEDAQRNWNDKIEAAFKELNEYQKPLLKEKRRLAVLFWVFGILSIVALVLVCLAIYMAGHKIYSSDSVSSIVTYLPYYSPIPMIGILLWVFIVQMNREQRQLLILSQHLHNLSYTEGLLKSINMFAPGIENAVSRINVTVDKLLDNHLSLHPALILKEDSFFRNEKNQSDSISDLVALLKEIRELVK